MNNDYVWIYNPEQNKFYINECKLNIEDMGTGNKGDAFIMYKNNKTYQEAFIKWKMIKYGDKTI